MYHRLELVPLVALEPLEVVLGPLVVELDPLIVKLEVLLRLLHLRLRPTAASTAVLPLD